MFIPSSSIGLATPVDDGATGNSNAIKTLGLSRGSAGLASDHGGTLKVQRYVDSAGAVPLGAEISVAVVAGTPNSVGWSDGLPCGSIKMSFVNSAGAVANLSNIAVNLVP